MRRLLRNPSRFPAVFVLSLALVAPSWADPGDDEDQPVVTPSSSWGQGVPANGDPDDYDRTRPVALEAASVWTVVTELVRVALTR